MKLSLSHILSLFFQKKVYKPIKFSFINRNTDTYVNMVNIVLYIICTHDVDQLSTCITIGIYVSTTQLHVELFIYNQQVISKPRDTCYGPLNTVPLFWAIFKLLLKWIPSINVNSTVLNAQRKIRFQLQKTPRWWPCIYSTTPRAAPALHIKMFCEFFIILNLTNKKYLI